MAPFIATKLGEDVSSILPYCVGAVCCAVAIGLLVLRRHHLGALAAH